MLLEIDMHKHVGACVVGGPGKPLEDSEILLLLKDETGFWPSWLSVSWSLNVNKLKAANEKARLCCNRGLHR